MDVMLLSHEDRKPYKSLYNLAVEKIRETQEEGYGLDKDTGVKKDWAIQFFAYDWLALVNAHSFQKIGGWDSMISYYGTDCDMHSRLGMAGMMSPIADGGDVWDVNDSVPDLEVLYRRRKKSEVKQPAASLVDTPPSDNEAITAGSGAGADSKPEVQNTQPPPPRKRTLDTQQPSSQARDPRQNGTAFGTGLSSTPLPPTAHTPSTPEIQAYLADTVEATLGDDSYLALKEHFEKMQTTKREAVFRNSWQLKQRGGEGEPYYYDADGWEFGLQATTDTGLRVVKEKWGVEGCDIRGAGVKTEDAWRVEKNF